ncbi:hypothetical protein KP509_19G035600 [Ceratopteris richardii]|uniref:Uncharacterized protein n=1 Tax=Ceratopteris richardii TaxID=49495 RepID=A0A8T2SMI5_CERRI|nr:hypothetical protein KP509_19G035600 [Ceratopteris richardii]
MSATRFIKCVIVGDGMVGKTCMLISYTSNTFPTDYVPMDTTGQKDYNRSCPLSYRGADVFLLTFFLDSKACFEKVIKKWIHELRNYAPGLCVILELQKQIRPAACIECSAKTQQNIKVFFDAAIKVVLQPPKPNKKKKSHQKNCILM